MKNLPILILFFYLVILLKYQTIKASSSTQLYIPVENIPLSCGFSRNQTAEDGREWMGDGKGSKFAPLEGPNGKSNTSRSVDQASAVDPVPYRTARISQYQFNYTFQVSPGPKFIRLYFYPTKYEGGFDSSKAFFGVKANSFTLLRNFSAYLVAKYQQQEYQQQNYSQQELLAIKKEFIVNVKEGHTLKLSFIPSPISSSGDSYAFVNGIEIVSMPAPLYYTPPEDYLKRPILIGHLTYQFGDYSSLALETLYRFNVGASSISPADDTGMYRKWSEDRTYSKSPGAVPGDPAKRIKYNDRTPNYTAPEDVYRTALTMGPNGTRNEASNLTWSLPVDRGFSYLVRLHFCEFQDWHSSPDSRVFHIFIDHQWASVGFSVIQWTFGVDIPLYRDFVVDIKSEDSLSIDLHPSVYSVYPDVIINGMEVFKMSNPDNNLAGPNPAPSNVTDQPSPSPTDNSKSKKTLFVSLGSGIGFFLILCTVCFVVLWRLKKSKQYYSYHPLVWCGCWEGDSHKGRSTRTKASSLPEELCQRFSLLEIKTATKNFDPDLVIGVGGFGNVYHGDIDEGAVAIKRLNPESTQGVREFITEIEMLSKLRYVHLVSLIGYCEEEGEMILVYDYMANGTLRDHLYGKDNDPLTWKKRLEICLGAARGLHYLHTGVENTVIHRDVKTTNILLDDKWVAKVSDFGLSKTGPNDAAVSTAVKGTFGYLDPEYARTRQLTDKSDVYSFGVVLFEVLCARKALDRKAEEAEWNLAHWARKCIQQGTLHNIIDPYLVGKIAPECFKKFVEIAESCVRDHGVNRPTMGDVMEKLEFVMVLQEQADDAKEKINPGGRYSYPEVKYVAVGTNREVLGLHSGAGVGAGASLSTTFVSETTGGSFPSLETDSETDDVFTGSSDSKVQK